jgi:alkanesulfonate monooxygenase SsuD/methylene tetrahydromethanopterin reductase-like flavin-dependent oxidoreductase (luciferase family)
MHVGMSAIFQHPDGIDGDQAGDAATIAMDYRLADRAEALGFDSLWSVEHHFDAYEICPDPLNFLTWFAARTSRIRLGTMVVVLPWHDPIRLCEDVSVLDSVSNGRLILGVGRGVAKTEFDGFRIDMNLTRDILIDHVHAIRMGLETGAIEYDGKALKQPRALIRPRPPYSFAGRFYGSAQSPESYPLFGQLGLGLLFIPGQKPWDAVARDLDGYRASFREHQRTEPPPPIFVGWTFVDEDEDRARDLGRKYIGEYVRRVLGHYQFHGDHLKGVRGYESYVAAQEAGAAAGATLDDFLDAFVEGHVYGTPDQCFEKIRDTREKLGAGGFLGVFNFAGMSEAEALRNQTLFAEKILPRLKQLEPGLDIPGPAGLRMAAE